MAIISLIKKCARGFAGGRPDDVRSRRVVALIECVLNQNARDCGAACSPAINAKVLEVCLRHSIGVIQIPCPEQAVLGLGRVRPDGVSLRDAMSTPAARACCNAIAESIVSRLKQYEQAGQTVVAILGGNPLSPGCATQSASCVVDAEGLLIVALRASLASYGLEIPILAIRDSDWRLHAQDINRFDRLCAGPPHP